MPWESIITLVNKCLDIYIKETDPIFVYKRRLNSKYQEWLNYKKRLQVIKEELKKALMQDLDEDVIILTHQRQEMIDKMNTVNNELEILWSMRDCVVPKGIIEE